MEAIVHDGKCIGQNPSGCNDERPEVEPAIAAERGEDEQQELKGAGDSECAADCDGDRLGVVLATEESSRVGEVLEVSGEFGVGVGRHGGRSAVEK